MIRRVIRTEIDAAIKPWLKEKGIDTLPPYTLDEPPKNIGSDLASNLALGLAKQLKTNPRGLATELAGVLKTSMAASVRDIEIAGAGFLNFHLNDDFLAGQVANILREQENFGRSTAGSAEQVLLEFVSANPTGPLHIGHGRGAAIGDSLARIYDFCGYRVQREYYLNDVGNQMLMLAKSLEIRYRQLKGEQIEFPEDGYRGQYMIDIAQKLVDDGMSADQIDFKKTAVDAMMATIGSDLEKFGVRFDTWFSEKTIAADRDPQTGKTGVDAVCDWLLEKGIAFENEGALWFATTRYGDDKDRVLRRSDGRYTYFASDIAYHKNKLGRGYGKLIDLWGADHHGYVTRLSAAVQALGGSPETLSIILYQLVSLVRNGQPVAMSTRAGEFVTLEEVLNEVGRDACRFFFLLRAPDSPLEFDLELAKKQSSDNPVFYVQYVHARCNSIFRESKNYFPEGAGSDPSLNRLTTKEERNLIKKLMAFDDTLELCLKTRSPHHVTAYLMEVADSFHRFYEHCRVLGDDADLSKARLALVESVAVVIRNGLNLLGVSAPVRM